MARTKRKELEKEAKRKGELSQKNPNVEKSVAASPLLLPQNSSNCTDSAVKFDSSLGQSLSLPKQWELSKHKAVVVQTESHVANKEYQLPSKDGTLCNRGGEGTKFEHVSSLQASHPHAPLSTLQKLNICDDSFMSESVGDTRPLTDSGGKVGNIKKSQSMTVTSSKRVLFPASLSSPAQLPRAVVCVEDICKSPDGNILKIMKRQSSKEPTEIEGASSGFEQNLVEFGDLLAKNSTDLSLTGDRTVSSTSTTKNIFEQFDTEIIGRRSPRLRSNSPRGNYSQGSPVFQDMSSRSNSEERQHSNIASAVRALRGISEKVSEVRSQTRVRNQESKLVSFVISDSKEASPESLSPQRHSPQGSSDMNPPELAIKAPKAKKTSPSPMPVENCETPLSGVKRGRSPRNLSDDIPSSHVSSQKLDNRGEECLSISSLCRKKPKMDDGASEDVVPSFQILSSTSVQAHLPFKEVQNEPQASSSLKTSEQFCVNTDLHSKDTGARKACEKSGYSRSFRIISSTSPQGHPSPKGIQRDPQAPGSFATSEQVCLGADSHKDQGVRKISCPKPGDEAIVTHSLSSQLCPQSQISGAGECAEGMEPSLLCAMLIGGSEVAKTYEKSREHIHANVPNMSRQQEPVALSSSSDSVADALLNGELTNDHLDAQTPYELPLLSNLPPLVKPNFGVLDLTLNEPVPFEEENVFVYKKNVVLLELISKVTDYLKQLGTTVDGSVIEDAEKALFEDGSEQKQLPFRIETPVIAGEQGMTSSQSDFKLNCDAHNKNLPQETRCEKLAADSSTYSPVNTVAINVVDENSGIDSGKKNSVEAHQPIIEQMQGSVQDKPDIDLANESSLASEKQKSLGELNTVIAKGTNQTAPKMLLVLPSSSKDLVKAVEKNKNISDLNTSVNQSTASGTSEPVGEPDKRFPESNITTTTSGREVKSGEISDDHSTSRSHWQPKVPSASHTGRPLWSRWHKIVFPSPLHILSRPEQPSVNKRLSPFISKELDAYLRKHSNRLVVPAGPKSKLAKILVLHGFFKDYSHLEAELNKHSDFGHCSGDDCPGRSDEDEEGDDEERDDFPQKFEPDFDEVDGLVFMSFANETAMESHIQVEKDLKWDKEPNAFLNIARFRAFEESRREDGTSRRESQGLRGQHMRWRKYQRMYRKEFRGRLEAKEKGLPWPLPRIPHKTSDVSKIKNWKRKLERDGIKTEDASGSQNSVCAGSDAASHKKKKRKTYVFSVKKKSKKSAPAAERVFNTSTISDHDVDDRSIEGGLCPSDMRSAEEEDDYGKPIPIDQDSYMEDVQNSLKEMEQKQKGIMLNKTLLGHLRMGPEDCEIFKKLGGWVTCQKPIKKGSGDKKFRNQTISSVTTGDLGNERKIQKKSKTSFILDRVREERAREAVLAIQRYDDVRDTHGSLQFSSDSNDMSVLSEGGDFMDLTGDSPSPTSSHKAKYSCDKPGCRYGCICHLCQSIGESDDLEQGVSATSQGRACDKEYCRLGCICESLEKSSKRSSPLHCRKPECVLECQCLKEVPCTSESPHPLVKAEADDVEKNLHIELKSEKIDPVDLAESSGDELPTLEKTNSRRQRSLDRYSNLPRRQTSYRIAKNLDAVSRKAMMLYETSEIYWEQSCNRRKKSADSPGSSAAVPFTASNTVSTYSDAIPITSDPCTSPPAATTLTLMSPFSRQGLTHAATAEHSQASIPISIACVTPSSGITLVPTSLKSPSTLGSDMCGQNHQKANQELSPVVISDDEGHANKMSSIQNQLDSPKSTKLKLFSGERTSASSSAQQSMSPPTTTSTQLASTPPLASVASGPSLTGLVSSAFSQPRWHTSMVCLRANPPGKEKKDTSDDVQEEDEIKLLEFIANCNWDSAKKNILLQVAQCLSRAQYPSPRTMFVGDFRVEILPKASKPSVIPPELRSKLPEMMYSIRVRVTPYRNANTPSPHPVGLFRNAATPAGVSVVPVPTGVIPLAISTHLKSPNKPDDLQEKFNQSSFGISGLGQLQINHNTLPSSLSVQGESVQLQGKKTKKRGDPDSAKSQQSGKRKRKKEKKKKVDAEGSSNQAADLKNKKESSPGNTPGTIKVPIISMGTTQSFPISKLMPLIPGVSSHQVIGPVANLKDLKFIQLPGQKSLLQLLPASALGIKPSPDGKGSPQFLAVPVPIAPVPLKGDSKRGGTKMQVDAASAHASSGGTQNSTQPVGGPVQLSADSNISSKKKKKKKRKKKEEKGKTSETSKNYTSICRSRSTTSTTMPASDASSVSVPSGFQEQSAPHSLQIVPSVGSPGSRMEGVNVGLKTPPPISSVLFGNQIISITSPGRQGTTGGGEQVMVATKATPDFTASSGCKDPSKVAPEKTVSLLANNKSLLSTAARILSSTSPGGIESSGEKVLPTVNPSQHSSAACADDYLTQLKTKTSKAKKKNQLLLVPPKQNRSPEKEGKFVEEDSLASVGSQGTESSNSLFLSEEDSADLEQENQMSGESNLVAEQSSSLTASREREKCIVPKSKNKSRVHLVHKQREKNRRAEHYIMFQHLKNVLFSIDKDRKLLPPLPKTKLLSKAELVIKYHQKRDLSLEKTRAVEQKRHALLKQQLDTKVDDLKQEGAAEETIVSILDSVKVSHLPRVPLDNRLSVEEQRLLASDHAAVGASSSWLTAASDSHSSYSTRLRSGSVASMLLSPWHVDHLARSVASSEESDSSQPISITSSTSRSASPAGSQPKEKRRKSCKPVKLRKKLPSQFVIEIERAEEDVGFMDGENSDFRVQQTQEDTNSFAIKDGREPSERLKQTLQQRSSTSCTADVRDGEALKDGDPGVKVVPPDRDSMSAHGVHVESKVAAKAGVQEHTGEDTANSDTVNSNLDLNPYEEAVGKGCPHDFLPAADVDSDVQ